MTQLITVTPERLKAMQASVYVEVSPGLLAQMLGENEGYIFQSKPDRVVRLARVASFDNETVVGPTGREHLVVQVVLNQEALPAEAPANAIRFAGCPNCAETVTVQMPTDWQGAVEAGLCIPIIGCGNPWHYVFPGGDRGEA